MSHKKFDLYEGINIDEKTKKFLFMQDKISDLIVELVSERYKKGISQRELAKITGIKQPMIARIEKFDAIPRLDTYLKIADALDLKPCLKNNMDLNVNINIYTTYKKEPTAYKFENYKKQSTFVKPCAC